MASIRKRGPYQWEVRIRRKGFPTQSKTFESKPEAEAWAAIVESEMTRGVFVSRAEAESTTLKDALGRYIMEYLPRLAYHEVEIGRAQRLQRRGLAKMAMASIRIKHVSDFVREREEEGVKPNTIRLELALLSRLFEVAATEWGMESLGNPVKRARKPKLPGGRTRRFENDEEERLLDACSDKLKMLFRFAVETAMRRTEISELDWRDVDINGRSLYLPRTKNSESRTVPLSPAAIEILEQMSLQTSGSVFGMSPTAITQAMRRATAQAEIKDFKFHDLRHEAISRLFENTDLDAIEIAAISGHKTMQMLKRYSHLRTARLADRLAGGKRKR